jgi:TPR repeat protein
MVDLGFLSDGGFGGPKDSADAAEWHRRTAERGDPVGQSNLVDFYLRGRALRAASSSCRNWKRN